MALYREHNAHYTHGVNEGRMPIAHRTDCTAQHLVIYRSRNQMFQLIEYGFSFPVGPFITGRTSAPRALAPYKSDVYQLHLPISPVVSHDMYGFILDNCLQAVSGMSEYVYDLLNQKVFGQLKGLQVLYWHAFAGDCVYLKTNIPTIIQLLFLM